jgi:hypothetical protein
MQWHTGTHSISWHKPDKAERMSAHHQVLWALQFGPAFCLHTKEAEGKETIGSIWRTGLTASTLVARL